MTHDTKTTPGTSKNIINGHAHKSFRALKIVGVILFLTGLITFTAGIFLGDYQLNDAAYERAAYKVPLETVNALKPLHGKYFTSAGETLREITPLINPDGNLGSYQLGQYKLWILKGAAIGPIREHTGLFLFLTLGLAILGGLLYASAGFAKPAGIKHDGIFFSSVMNRGLLGILLGSYLISFYILLYWFPEYIVNLIILFDPVSELLRSRPADQWFLYGSLYTVAVAVMGTRMYAKYRHNRYHLVRTTSVIFFQTGFAFLLPSIMERLNQPSMDLKNAWPLNYSFFTDWHLNSLLNGGNFGLFLLFWGILLSLVVVPFMTYRYGKRWYCSWVCGCGGLAETLGDPFRQLSNKSLRAWRVERVLIYSVLVFAVVMTIMQVANYLSNGAIFSSYTWRVNQAYSFFIGSIFAGVVGTGFYPLMGNRVWCRFGCPLAAIMGIVQKIKSRFVITTNGAQCISCGNCSTYCEMGIDVRWYAQRGQNIVRASCVGCGVCAAVCPRGVLKLENTTPGERYNVALDDAIIAQLDQQEARVDSTPMLMD